MGMKNLLVLSLFLATLFSVTAADTNALNKLHVGASIRCGGLWDGRLQGICSDGKSRIYWVFNNQLIQSDLKGKVINATMLKRENGTRISGGSPCYADDKIYVPYGGLIQVYNENELTYVKSLHIPELIHGAGAIAFARGNFFIAAWNPPGVPGNLVLECSPEFEVQKKYHLNFSSNNGIEALSFDGRDFWIGISRIHPVTIRADRNFNIRGFYNFSGSSGMIAFPKNKILLANWTSGRKHLPNPQVKPTEPHRNYAAAVVKNVEKLQITVIRLELDLQGNIFLNGKLRTPEQLCSDLRQFHRKHFVIQVPAQLPAEKLVAVTSLIKHRISCDVDIELLNR